MPNESVDMYTIEDLEKDQAISLDNLVVYVNTSVSGYHGITEGYRPILVINEEDGEYIVRDNNKIIMIETLGDFIRYRHISTNPYVGNPLEEYLLIDNTEEGRRNYVIKLLEGIAQKLVSFGGEEPYIETYKNVLLEVQEGEPVEEPEEPVEEDEMTEPE